MDLLEFTDRINALTARIRDLKDHATTEESTKNALINPFLNALGYDTTDPRIVQFEYTADIGVKKGEKVDYAIIRNNEVIFLIEAKKAGSVLDGEKASQLHRYFHNTKARIAILTDGIKYEFYSDLDSDNVMDKKPFMVFDFDYVDDKLIAELHKISNVNFDINAALLSAQNLKHCTQLKQVLKKEMANPSSDLIKVLASQITDKVMRANVIDEFRPKVKRAFAEYINEELMNRIKGVPIHTPAEESVEEEEVKTDAIVTTQDEIEAFMIIKSILRKDIPLSKIAMRDAQSYCSILFDDNNRKPICRLQFGTKLMFIHIFAEKDKPEKIKIESIDDIYQHSDLIVKAAMQYMEG